MRQLWRKDEGEEMSKSKNDDGIFTFVISSDDVRNKTDEEIADDIAKALNGKDDNDT